MMMFPIDLLAECEEEKKKGDASLTPDTIKAYFDKQGLGEPRRLQGKGNRHWYVVHGGKIDSQYCFQEGRGGIPYIVPNEVKLVCQEKAIMGLVTGRVANNAMEFSISRIHEDGTLAPAQENKDFCKCWKSVFCGSRAGYVLKDPKIQEAIVRQLNKQDARSKASQTSFSVRLLNYLDYALSAAQAASPSPPVQSDTELKKPKHQVVAVVEQVDVWNLVKDHVVDFEYEHSTLHKLVGSEERFLRLLDFAFSTESFFITFNLGLMQFSAGKYEQALQTFYEAEDMHNSGDALIDAKTEHLLKRWIARTLQKVGKIDDAEKLMDQVLVFFTANKSEHNLPVSLSDLGWIYHDRINADKSNVDKAINVFSRAISLRQVDHSVANKRILIEEYYALGCIYALCDNMAKESTQMFDQSHKLAKEVLGDQPPPMLMSRVYRGLALGYMKQNLWDDAITWINQAIEYRIEASSVSHPQVANLYFLVSAIYDAAKDIESAAQFREKANKIWDMNGVAQDHPWRSIPRELSFKYTVSEYDKQLATGRVIDFEESDLDELDLAVTSEVVFLDL